MKEARIFSGYTNLDETTTGYPKGAVIAYWTDDTSLRLSSIKHLVTTSNEKTLIVTTQFRPEDLNGISKSDGSLIYIDAISWRYRRVNPDYSKEPGKFDVMNLTDLNNLFAKITQAIKENDGVSVLIFDTISNLLMYSIPSKEQFFRFFELLVTFTRSNGITLIYTINSLIHKTEILETLRFLSDGTIEFSHTEDGYKYRIHDLLHVHTKKGWNELS